MYLGWEVDMWKKLVVSILLLYSIVNVKYCMESELTRLTVQLVFPTGC